MERRGIVLRVVAVRLGSWWAEDHPRRRLFLGEVESGNQTKSGPWSFRAGLGGLRESGNQTNWGVLHGPISHRRKNYHHHTPADKKQLN